MRVLQKFLSWFYPIRIEESRGELNHILEVNMYHGRKHLDTANVNYSYGALQEVFDNAFTQTDLYDKPVRSALILGFGSGCVADLLLKNCNPQMIITGVEADAEVIRLAKKHFPVSNSEHIVLIHSDATRFVVNERNRYDLIIVDIFIEDVVPENCLDREFLHSVKHLLSENGAVYFNKMDLRNDATSQNDLEKNLKQVFGTVKDIRVHRGGSGNHVYVAH